MAVFGGDSGSTAVSSQYLNKHLKAIAIPNLTTVTHFLPEFLRFKEWFQKLPHPPPPFIVYYFIS